MSTRDGISLVECPRDAIQGIKHLIPTERKIAYINQLIESELFEYIDFGSFVSHRAVPQMADTGRVVSGIKKINKTKLLAIIANIKGAEMATLYSEIDYLGYPFSISETFQMRNANCSMKQSFQQVGVIKDSMLSAEQDLVVYISMAFGNPYGDPWSVDMVLDWIGKLSTLGISRFSIADTTSQASAAQINTVFTSVKQHYSECKLSLHLHSNAEDAAAKIEAGYEAGCRIFEGAIMGYGGCPFAQDDLVGNMPTELLLHRFGLSNKKEILTLLERFQHLITRDEV